MTPAELELIWVEAITLKTTVGGESGETNPGVVETVAFSALISRRPRVLLRLGALWLILVPLDLRTEIHTPHNAAV